MWKDRIPYGKLSLLEGDTDVGKSLVAYDLAARISTGSPMPGETSESAPGGAVILSAEDALGDTIRPRLEAAGADLSRILGFTFDALPTIPDDLSYIERAIVSAGARLVIVDPLAAFLGERVRATSDQQVRRALTPLAALAERTGAAILAILHLTKNRAMRAKYRGAGSIGILGAVRPALLVARDPDDSNHRVIAPVKQNLCAPCAAVAFSVEPVGIAVKIVWTGETSHTADTLLAHPLPGAERVALGEAVAFLRTALAEGERPASEVLHQAALLGIAEITLRRARKGLGVQVRREGFGSDGRFLLALPATEPDGNEERGRDERTATT